MGTGGRKKSEAAFFWRGSGKVFVYGNELGHYFSIVEHAMMVRLP
jgi:ribosomal protein S9